MNKSLIIGCTVLTVSINAAIAEKSSFTLNLGQLTFNTGPDYAQDNTLFWNLVPDKPNDLVMANTLVYTRIDLDDDGQLDLIGTLAGNSYFCGKQGAECALFAVVKGQLIKSICNAPVYKDITVLTTKHHGLRDITWQAGCFLTFNGKDYYIDAE